MDRKGHPHGLHGAFAPGGVRGILFGPMHPGLRRGHRERRRVQPFNGPLHRPGRCHEGVGALHLGESVEDRPPRDREQVVAKFAEFAKDNAAVRLGARSLGGRRLWCHCRPHELCHGDVLAELHAQELLELAAASPGEPAPFPRAQVFGPEAVAAMSRIGKGEPLKVNKKGVEVHVVDGAGVCSPGKWLVKDRADVAPDFSRRARDVLRDGVRRWCLAIGGDLRQVLFALTAG